MSVGMNATARVSQSLGLKTDLGLTLVAEASLTCLTALRDRLLASQDVMPEDDPMLEDEDLDDADECEFDLGDEDVPDEEDEAAGILGQEIGSDWTRNEGFTLRVTCDPKGEWQVNVPLCGWEGLVGRTWRGKGYVDAVSARQLVYLRLADWLEEKHSDVLMRGPFEPVKPLMGQMELLAEQLDDHFPLFKGVETIDGKSVSTAAANLSRYLKHVDLSWPQGSMPLRKLFED